MFVQQNPLVTKPINIPAACAYAYVCVHAHTHTCVYGAIVVEESIWSKDEE